jgi:two-component system, chemotaxis family, protein-glutamate methylesterase/glutaminase
MSTPLDVLAVGGSAGGVEALIELVARLPAGLPSPVLVTVHVGGNASSNLPHILTRSGPLPAGHARHGEPLRPGHIYVAPPDFHLLTGNGVARLSSGPRVNRHRPAIDVMFASAARWAGNRLVAVVLSGVLDDGAVGAGLVACAGGRVVVQDPADALFDSMPRAALAAVPAAVAAPTARLAKVVGEVFAELKDGRRRRGDKEEGGPVMDETRMADSDDPAFLRADEARLTRLSCPECSGVLAEVDVGGLRYYRCHVGHRYSPQSLEVAQREAVEAKLWAAAAALEEHAALARHLATRATPALGAEAAESYRREADRSSDAMRALLVRLQDGASGDPAGAAQARSAG